MKRSSKFIIILVVLLIVTTGCGKSSSSSSSSAVSSSQLIGTWIDSQSTKVVFSSPSSFTLSEVNPSCSADGTWQLNGNKLDLAFNYSDCSGLTAGQTSETSVAISGKTMTWAFSGGTDSFQLQASSPSSSGVGACFIEGCGVYGCVASCENITQSSCSASSGTFYAGQTCP